jgi:hypothetical protein
MFRILIVRDNNGLLLGGTASPGSRLGYESGGCTTRKISVLLAVSLFSGIMGCAKKDNDCAQKLPEKIKVGASQSDVEQLLDQCGFTHSFDQKTTMIYALKRGDKDGLVKQDWSARIKLDEGLKVTSVNVEQVFTGP